MLRGKVSVCVVTGLKKYRTAKAAPPPESRINLTTSLKGCVNSRFFSKFASFLLKEKKKRKKKESLKFVLFIFIYIWVTPAWTALRNVSLPWSKLLVTLEHAGVTKRRQSADTRVRTSWNVLDGEDEAGKYACIWTLDKGPHFARGISSTCCCIYSGLWKCCKRNYSLSP